MPAFQREISVRFGHCDPAGWVFYPRYFEMLANFVEDWLEYGLEASAPGLMHHQGIFTPTVHLSVDFFAPNNYGDRLTFTLWVARIGRSSVELDVEGTLQTSPRMRMRHVLVFIDRETRKSKPIPRQIVKRMRDFLRPPRSGPAAKRRRPPRVRPARTGT
ncbi:MAG: thioesterase family protein [Steroidobacteraceae bacterium]